MLVNIHIYVYTYCFFELDILIYNDYKVQFIILFVKKQKLVF